MMSDRTADSGRSDPLEEIRQMRLQKLRACALKQKAEMEQMMAQAEDKTAAAEKTAPAGDDVPPPAER